jgi:hypothetical protein
MEKILFESSGLSGFNGMMKDILYYFKFLNTNFGWIIMLLVSFIYIIYKLNSKLKDASVAIYERIFYFISAIPVFFGILWYYNNTY